MWQTFGLVIFNKCIFVPLAIALNAWFNDYSCPFRTDFDSLPGAWELFVTFIFCLLTETLAFTTSHTILHHKRIYPYIHKIHHQYVTTISISGEYAHPVEYLLGNILPVALGPAILGKHIHLYTVMVIYVARIVDSVEEHSGYNFSWVPQRLLPFFGDAEYHDFHHSHNLGNYSGIWVYDSIMRSNREFYSYKKLK